MMMKKLLLLTLLIAVPAQSQPEAKKATDLQAMNGSWVFISAELGGQKLPAEVLKSLTLILNGGKYTVKSAGADDTGSVKVDSAKSPKEMDIIGEAGPNKGNTLLAIYQLDGDTLRICYDLEGKQRPTEFQSKPNTKQFLAVYQRKKGE